MYKYYDFMKDFKAKCLDGEMPIPTYIAEFKSTHPDAQIPTRTYLYNIKEKYKKSIKQTTKSTKTDGIKIDIVQKADKKVIKKNTNNDKISNKKITENNEPDLKEDLTDDQDQGTNWW